MKFFFIALYSAIGTLPAVADQCDAQTLRVIQATGSTFERRSPSNENVFLKHPLAREFTMACNEKATGGRGSINISAGSAFPPAAFFDLIASAASASLGISPIAVRSAAIKCHKQAIKSTDEVSEIYTRALEVDCHAFGRDGGNTFISVWPPRKD